MQQTLALLAVIVLLSATALFAEDAKAKKALDWENGGGTLEDKPAADPAKAQALPRVLIIGDSISMGYTKPLQDFLKGKAEVVHPPGNCQDSGTGVKGVKSWIEAGGKKWDVIHFNFGIWDTHYLDKKSGALIRDESKVSLDDVRVRWTPEEYRDNLKKIIAVLKPTGAKLIFSNTTPILWRTGDRFQAIPKLNEVAAELMKEEGIEVLDLYSASTTNKDKWIGGDKVHMTGVGSSGLAEIIGKKVLATLEATAATQPGK